MVFSSLEFLLIFMPVFFGVYYSVPDKYRNLILLFGSLSFYAVGTVKAPMHFAIFILSMLVDFFVGRRIEADSRHKKLYLSAGIIFHLLSLGFFKYFTFIFTEINKVIPSFDFNPDILLPIGISFYTFQGISYIADVYNGKVKSEKSLLRYCVYISMFEQLIAGPIVTYPQVKDKLKSRKIFKRDVTEGFGTFVFGMGLKVLLANPIGKLWTDINTIGFESISTPLAWMAIIAFTFQIYFDFFGYSLMAVGLGKMLGFKLPKNFDFPYLSTSMTEFWRRWHITLGAWFREYVYIPLGGNRKGSIFTVRNLFIVWILTGIWHGAGYNFLLWGLILFLLIFLEKYVYGNFLNKHRIIGHLYMLLLIPLSWAVFAINDINQLGIFFTRLFPFFGEGPWSVFRYDYLKYLKMYYPFFIGGTVLSFRFPFRILKRLRKPLVFLILLIIFGSSIYCMYRGFNDPFLYFRF